MPWSTSAYAAVVVAIITFTFAILTPLVLLLRRRSLTLAPVIVLGAMAAWTARRVLGTDEVLTIGVENEIVCLNNVDHCRHTDVLTHAGLATLFIIFQVVREKRLDASDVVLALLDGGIGAISFFASMVEDGKGRTAGLALATILHFYYGAVRLSHAKWSDRGTVIFEFLFVFLRVAWLALLYFSALMESSSSSAEVIATAILEGLVVDAYAVRMLLLY